MLIKYDIKNEIFQKIQHLIEKRKYQDLNEFLSIAISNQVNEEFAESGFLFEQIPITTIDNAISLKELDKIQTEKDMSLEFMIDTNWREKLKIITLPESDIDPEYDDLIWSFYNRLFPVKLIIYCLGTMLGKERSWVDLTDLQALSYNLAIKISENLRKYEDEHESSRNQRLSTGLPTPESELNNVKKIREKRKIKDRINSSRKRFMEQFIGRQIRLKDKNIKKFKGACFDLGLMAVNFSDNTVLVSLTQTGKEFALLENPILDMQKRNVSFSNAETDFILKKIIPKFKFENIIVNVILQNLKKEKLSANEINEIFKEEKMKFLKEKGASIEQIEEYTEDKVITAERVATMSRLSELGLARWEIDKRGFSSYSLK